MAFLHLIVLGAATAVSPLPATAPDQPKQAQVQYIDLDLSTQAGRDTLDRRVASAVRMVCRKGLTDRATSTRGNNCRRRAWAEAAPQIASARAPGSRPAIAVRF